MSSFDDPAVPLDAIPVVPKKRHWLPVLIAWLVIAGVIVAELALSSLQEHRTLTPAEESRKDPALLVMQLQGRFLLGEALLAPEQKNFSYSLSAWLLNRGSLDQRLRFAILAGELSGPKEALRQLQHIKQEIVDSNYQVTNKQADLRHLLQLLYDDYDRDDMDAPSLSSEAKQRLRDELGWFGKLALAPAGGPNTDERTEILDSARQAAAVAVAVEFIFGLLGLGGAAGLVVFLVLVLTGRIQCRFRVSGGHGGVYAETFAVYMILFFSMSYGVAELSKILHLESFRLLLAGGAMLLSLAALAWPTLRGVPWRTVREDIGWTNARRAGLELAAGLGGYAMSLPLLAVGLIIFLVLFFFSQLAVVGNPAGPDTFRPSQLPTHPIIQILAEPNWWLRIQVLVLASIVAPIVEETMFRGVLYRHLREGSYWMGTFVSVLFSGTVASFIFAVIHPQGPIAIPVLMALAYGFTILREWRGTVLPCMVAHGVSNGLALSFAMFVLSG
jgi:membrane protease YdiL (CAAX protease family)